MRPRNHRLRNAWDIFVAQLALLVVARALLRLKQDYSGFIVEPAAQVEKVGKDIATLGEWNQVL